MSRLAAAAAIDDASVNDLKASFRGELIRPADAGYDEHRKVWNGSIDRRPSADCEVHGSRRRPGGRAVRAQA